MADEKNYFADKEEWYILQTYRGFEDAVKRDIERRIVHFNMGDKIYKLFIPEQTIISEDKKGNKKEVVQKLFPGYVFIKMMVTDETWYMVRNTPHVTGFLGSSGGGAKPVPIEDDEMQKIFIKCNVESEILPKTEYKVGDHIRVIGGAYDGSEFDIVSVDNKKQQVTVMVSIFGSETEQPLDFADIKKIEEN